MRWRRVPKCSRCGRGVTSAGCLRCPNIERGHTKVAKRKGIDPTPHPCPNPGCNRTVRGGVCPGPNC